MRCTCNGRDEFACSDCERTTATKYRWLDRLTAPYWWAADYLAQRRFWKVMAIGNESWRESRRKGGDMWRRMTDEAVRARETGEPPQ